jgi:hypothetical protein
MEGVQTTGAGCIDSCAGPKEVIEPTESIRRHCKVSVTVTQYIATKFCKLTGISGTCRKVLRLEFAIALKQRLVLVSPTAHMYRCPAACSLFMGTPAARRVSFTVFIAESCNPRPTILESSICALKQSSLLWIHAASFCWSQGEERGIENRNIFFDKMSSPNIDLQSNA